MVGILIISHSKKVAEGIKDIALQMVQTEIPIASCGGNIDGGIGTNTSEILENIEKLKIQAEGIVVILDIGSSVMSTELILETLPDEERNNILIADAPILEGAIIAAIEASMGSSLLKVKEAAEGAANMKKLNN